MTTRKMRPAKMHRAKLRGTKLRAAKLLGVVRRRRGALLLSTALQASVMLVLSVPGHAQPAPNARPAGGVVVAGQAAISRSPTTTTIDQASQRAALNWQSFDVGSQQAVQFNQPNAQAATLNRVVGPNPSQIAGRITANGTVVLVNQDGVLFSRGAQINTGGLIVSAAGISNHNFMAGHMVFDQAAHPNARVENQGNITIRETGLAALVAPQVANSGVINARLGHVVLAGATAATLDLYGDGLVSIDVTKKVERLPIGPDGKPVTALVTNSGTVLAEGGTVQLTAQAVDGIVTNLVTAGGRIAAPSSGGKTGVVTLTGTGGSIVVAGQLDTTGAAPGEHGGAIRVAADAGVRVAKGAQVDASGAAGGGTVALGTTLARAKGGSGVVAKHTSAKVTVEAGASIAADATAKGNGGRVVVLSSDTTRMDGAISAKGGPAGGDGGFAEVSGEHLGFNGSIDVGAPAGALGSILFDPGTLNVTAAAGSLDPLTPPGVGSTDGGSTESASATAIEALSGDVTLQATALLDVKTNLTVSNALLLQSGGDLLVDNNVAIKAGTTLSLNAGVFDFKLNTVGAAGSIGLGTGVSLTGTDLLALHGGSTGVVLSNAVLNSPTVDISAFGGGVTQATGGILNASTLLSSGNIIGSADFAGTLNAVGTLGGLFVIVGNLTLADTGNLTISGPVTASSMTIGSGTITVAGNLNGNPASGVMTLNAGAGGIVFNGGSVVSTATLDLAALGGGVTESASSTINAGTLQSTGGVVGPVALGNGNSIATVGAFAVTGLGNDFALTNTADQDVTIAGPLTATRNVTIANSGTSGAIAVSGSLGAGANAALSSGDGGIALNGGAVVTGTTLALNGAGGGIALNGSVTLGQAGALVDLTASGVGVQESGTSRIIADTLQSTGGVVGPVVLTNGNLVDAIGAFAVTGAGNGFALINAADQQLTVAGPLTAVAGIALGNSGTAGIIISGSLGAGGTASIAPGSGGIALNAGTITGQDAVLDGGGGTVSIAVGGLVGLIGNLTLTNAAAVTEDAGGTIVANVVQGGTGLAGAVALDGAANSVAQLAGVSAGGRLSLADARSVLLVGLSADGVSIHTTGTSSLIQAFGTIDAGASAATLKSDANPVFVGGTVTGSLIDLSGTSVMLLPGATLAAGGGSGVLDVTTTIGAFNDGPVTAIRAGTLQSAGGLADGANLMVGSHTIAALGAIAAGGDFNLNNTGDLTIVDAISASGTHSINVNTTGSLGIGVAAGAVGSLSASAGTVMLGAGGTISEPNGAITAGQLNANSTGGGVLLTDGGNAIAAINGITAPGTIVVIDNVPTLTLSGGSSGAGVAFRLVQAGGTLALGSSDGPATVSAASGNLMLEADRMTEVSTSVLTAPGAVELAPFSSIPVSLGTSGVPNVLELDPTLLGIINAGTLRVGGVTQGASIVATASSIDIGGALNLTGTIATLDVRASGEVAQAPGAILSVGTLVGNVGSLALGGEQNAVSNLGPLTATNGPAMLKVGGTLDVVGGVSASGAVELTSGDTMTLDADVHGGASVSLTANGVLSNIIQNAATVDSGGPVHVLVGQNFFENSPGVILSTGDEVSITAASMDIAGGVTASASSVRLIASGALAGQGITLATTAKVIGGSGLPDQVVLQGDTLSIASGATISGRTVAIAPFSGIGVSLGGVGGLAIAPTALNAISATALRVGGFVDDLGAQQVTATGIAISAPVDLRTGIVASVLRLDASGPISESGTGLISVGTLSASTNGAVGDVLLGGANTISVLGDVAVGSGLFTLGNGGDLTESAGSTVYATNVSITNLGSVTLAGNLASSAGDIGVTTTAGDIGVTGGLIGATGAITFTAAGAFGQFGGTINAGSIVVTGTNGVSQSGGTLFGFGVSGTGVSIGAPTGGFTQTGGVIGANDEIAISVPGVLSVGSTIIGVGNVTLASSGLVSSGGTVLSGADLLVQGSGVRQTGGLLAASGRATLSATGTAEQIGGTVAGSAVSVLASGTGGGEFANFAGALGTMSQGSTTVAQVISGAAFPGDPPGAAGSLTLPSVSTGTFGTLAHLLIDIENATDPPLGSYTINNTLAADWVEIHTSGSLSEGGSGVINAGLFSGSAGVPTNAGPYDQVSDATLNGANTITWLGPFAATGNLSFTGNAYTVVDAVTAGANAHPGKTLALTATSLAVDHTLDGFTVIDGHPVVGMGSLIAGADISGGLVTPGEILLRADTLTIPALGALGIVSAPDGLIAIAPMTAGRTITLLGDATGGALVLGGGSAPLAAFVTRGVTPGTPGVATLALGSLDAGATTPSAGAIVLDVNGGTIDVTPAAATLQLNTTGAVTEQGSGTLAVAGLAGSAASFALEPSGIGDVNSIATIGNALTRIAAGTTYTTDGAVLGGVGNMTDLRASGGDVRIRSTNPGAALTIVGTISAPDGATVALSSPMLVIDHLTTTTGGALDSLGAISVGASVNAGFTVFPGQVLLASDALRVLGTAGSVVSAPAGMVAIAPYSTGSSIDIAPVGDSLPHAGTVAVGDLNLIDTLGGTLGVTPGPLGTETLVFGSLNNGGSITAGSITIDAPLDVSAIASTVALFATGDITQGAGATITATMLTGAAGIDSTGAVLGLGSITLGELNQIGTIGNQPTAVNGGTIFISSTGGVGDLLATGGITVQNGTNLVVLTTAHAGDDPTLTLTHGTGFETAAIGVAVGTLMVPGTVWAGADNVLTGHVSLAAGSGIANGTATIAPSGAVFASNAGSVVIAAGFSGGVYSAGCGISDCNVVISGVVWGNSTGAFAAGDTTASVQVNAASSIDESLGRIGTSLLTGGAGGFANFSGGANSVPSSNFIANMGAFDTNQRFDVPVSGLAGPALLLRDGRDLTVSGAVTDHGSQGISFAVVPSAGTNTYGIADLNIKSTVSASGTIALQATGNVYEGSGGSGLLVAGTLIAQSGALPDTEQGGNTPGTEPGKPLSLASVWLGNLNQIGTLANATATQEFLLNNGQGLAVPVGGAVLAGAADPALLPAVTIGTPIVPHTNPRAEIDVTGGDLIVNGIVHAGLDSGSSTPRAGDVTLSTQDVLVDRNVVINGGVFAGNGGTVGVSAGPGGISITGTIWGDVAPTASLAALVTLSATTAIDETAPGRIGAVLLTGNSGGHTSLVGDNPHTGNRIVSLGPFNGDTITGDPTPGFTLHDGAALTIVGAVTDPFAVSVSVAPPDRGAGYDAGDLTLQSTVSAANVVLQATGNVVEQTGGLVVASTLTAQAGAVPDTELGGNVPGSIPGTPIGLFNVTLGNVNQVSTLANGTATQDFWLRDGSDVSVPGTVLAGAAIGGAGSLATLDVTGDLTVGGIVHSGLNATRTGDVTLIATRDIGINGGVFAAASGNVTASAGGDINIPGVIWGDGPPPAGSLGALANTVSLHAGGDINEFDVTNTQGTIGAGLLTGDAGGHAYLAGAGSPTSNRIVILGPFTSNTGFLLRDGEALTVVGAVSDPTSVSMVVAPPGVGPYGYGVGDLRLIAPVISASGVTLQATGNVVELTGGIVQAGSLTTQAGVIPDTEAVAGANTPGTTPAPGSAVALASIWLGNTNQVGDLASATATQEFLLNNGPSLLVSGTVLAGAADAAVAAAPTLGTPILVNTPPMAAISAGGDLTVNGTVHSGLDSGSATPRTGDVSVSGANVTIAGGVFGGNGGDVGVSGGSIGISGVIWGDMGSGFGLAGAVNLAAGGQIDETGRIGAMLLTGSAGTHASLTGANPHTDNQIVQLGPFDTNRTPGADDPLGFELHDGIPLTVAGTITDHGTTASQGVAISVAPWTGAVYSVGDLDVAAAITAPTMVRLEATGNVFEQGGGIITAPTLVAQAGAIPGLEIGGNAPGTIPTAPVSLASIWLSNVSQIGTLANATATQELLLNNGKTLIVPAGGTVLAGAAIGTIAAAGTAGTPIMLNPHPTASITATGDLAVNGTIHAGLDGARIGDVLLAAPDVAIAGGAFAGNGGTVGITATTGSITIPGVVRGDVAPGGSLAALVTLSAATAIDETGAIGADLLTGSSGWHAGLTGANPHTGNVIRNLGTFDSDTVAGDPNPGFTLHDGVATLTLTGPVTDHAAGVVIANAPSGTLTSGYGLGDVVLANTVSAVTTANLQATGNVFETTGSIVAPNLIAQAGAIPDTETAAGANHPGVIPAAPLARSSVWLGNVNQIGTLAAAGATEAFRLNAAGNLTLPAGATLLAGTAPASLVAAPVPPVATLGTNPAVTLSLPGTLTVAGLLHAGLDGTQAGDVTVNAGWVSVPGTLVAAHGGTIAATSAADISVGGSLIAAEAGAVAAQAGGAITVGGTLAGGDIAARAGTDITVPGIVLAGTAGTLAAAAGHDIVVGGSIDAGALSAAAGNMLSAAGRITGTAITANAGTDIGITGIVLAGNSASLTAGHDISVGGSLDAGALAATAGNTIGVGGWVTGGGISLTAGTDLNVGGSVLVANTGSLTVTAGHNIGVNGNLAAGDVSATAGNALSVGGRITAGTATLRGAGLSIPVVVNAGTLMTLIAGNSIDAPGNLITPKLTGSAGSNAVLTGDNTIAQIDGFSAGGTLAVKDNAGLLLTGTLRAPLITIGAAPHEITLGDGAAIVTGGNARPPGTVVTLPSPGANNGAYLSDFRQLGLSTVAGIDGGPSILLIDATDGHNIAFDGGGGLRAEGTWLVLKVVGRAAITGNVFVNALDVDYTGTGGSAALFGSIDKIGGQSAAGAGNIQPKLNADFRFNTCPIHSVNCVLLPTLAIPVGNPLQDFSLGTLADPDEDDLLLPIVSDKDY